MTNVDVFGRAFKKSTSVFKILSNGGLNSVNDFLSVKVDPNTKNILSISANGLMVNGIKSSDAATKDYVDNRKVKNTSGFIPNLYGNSSKQGFAVKASSEFNQSFQGWNVFSDTNNEWAAKGLQVNGYIQIQLPFPVAIWAFALRGRGSGSERWFNWVIEASNDGEIWTILYSATEDHLGNRTKFYILQIISNKYLYYRFYGVNGELTNPGLSYMQIYTVDDLL